MGYGIPAAHTGVACQAPKIQMTGKPSGAATKRPPAATGGECPIGAFRSQAVRGFFVARAARAIQSL